MRVLEELDLVHSLTKKKEQERDEAYRWNVRGSEIILSNMTPVQHRLLLEKHTPLCNLPHTPTPTQQQHKLTQDDIHGYVLIQVDYTL